MMTDVVSSFKAFLADAEASEMFITGVAGTGKTTSLHDILEYCMGNRIEAVTCAYTHQAVRVLRSKLPKGATTCTLHSYLKKRPTVNASATKLKHVEGNLQSSAPEFAKVLFIDEFSMVGEKDFVDIVALQFDDEGDVRTKVVYIGDPNQLPPVKDQATINPRGRHCVMLTEIHRQAADNPLIQTLLSINDMINGKAPTVLMDHSKFIRDQDIVELYRQCRTTKVMLAYTNAQVEYLNAQVQGYDEPKQGDDMFSPTLRREFQLGGFRYPEQVGGLISIRGNLVELGSKYKTLETLLELPGVSFYDVVDQEDEFSTRAVVFGHYAYLTRSQELMKAAVDANRKIEGKFKEDPKEWSDCNRSHPMAKERASAWKNYLSFKENVLCMDFAHAMTVHKSQGATYENVFIDMEDIGKCADRDYSMYLKLLYVAISRASNKVYTN